MSNFSFETSEMLTIVHKQLKRILESTGHGVTGDWSGNRCQCKENHEDCSEEIRKSQSGSKIRLLIERVQLFHPSWVISFILKVCCQESVHNIACNPESNASWSKRYHISIIMASSHLSCIVVMTDPTSDSCMLICCYRNSDPCSTD